MWTATFLAVAFAVVGVGSQNLTFAFQLTFVGSVAFGMLAIDAIDTDRTWLAPLWLVGSLMCSDIGIPMIVACGLVALAQRKLREAAIAVGPPIFIFLVWYLAIGYHGSASNSTSVKFDLGGLSSYVWTGLTSSFSGFLDAPHFVGVLIALLLGAAAIVYRNAPAALAASVLPLYVFIGLGGCTRVSASRRCRATRISPLPWSCHSLDCWSRRRCASLTCGPLVLIALGLLIAVNLVVLHRQQVAQQSYLSVDERADADGCRCLSAAPRQHLPGSVSRHQPLRDHRKSFLVSLRTSRTCRLLLGGCGGISSRFRRTSRQASCEPSSQSSTCPSRPLRSTKKLAAP